MKVLSLLAALLLSFPNLQASQQASAPSPNSSPQAAALLQSAYPALVGIIAVNDVTLTGTVERIAGGGDETGSGTYRAVRGSNRLDLSFSSGTTSEIRCTTVSGVAGNWIDSNGITHPMAGHSVMADVGGFPLFTIGGITSSANSVLRYVGVESRDGSSVIHVTAWQQFPLVSGKPAILPQHLFQTDLYLDPATFLPRGGQPRKSEYASHPSDSPQGWPWHRLRSDTHR